MTPRDCPRYERCSVPICPLDPDWPTAAHLPGEPVCPYLLASGKAGAAEHYADSPVYTAALIPLPLITARFPAIARAVTRAARYGLRTGRAANFRGSATEGTPENGLGATSEESPRWRTPAGATDAERSGEGGGA